MCAKWGEREENKSTIKNDNISHFCLKNGNHVKYCSVNKVSERIKIKIKLLFIRLSFFRIRVCLKAH